MSLRASFAYVGLRAMAGVFSVATMALFARTLGPTGYAEVAVCVAAALLIGAVSLGPLHSALARFHGDTADRVLLVNLFRRIAIGILAIGCGIAAVWTDRAVLVLATAVLAISQGAFDYAVQDATAALDTRRVGRLYVSRSLVAICGALVVWWHGGEPWGAIAVLAASVLVAVGSSGRAAFACAWIAIGTVGRARLHEIKSFAAPLAAVSALVFCVQWADRTVVGVHLGAHTFGAYVAVSELAQQIVGMLFGGIAAAWYPRLVRAHAVDDDAEVQRLFDRYVELLCVLLIPAVVGFAAVLPYLAHIVFGAEFRIGSSLWAPMIALGAGFAGAKSYLCDLPLFLRKRTLAQAVIVAAAAAASALASVILVPRFGVTGAALAYLTATFAGCVASLLAGRGLVRIAPRRRTLVGVTAATAAMLAIVLAIIDARPFDIALAIGLASALYLGVLWLMNVSDVRAATTHLLRRPRRAKT